MKFTLKGIWETREIFINGKRLSPAKSQKVVNHSPDGFNWGYGGSGPAQLALGIMIEVTGNPGNYQDFKWKEIAALPKSDFEKEIEIIEENVTLPQALETYRLTTLNEERNNWPVWIIAVSNSLAAGEWIGYAGCPAYGKEVFDELIKTNKPRMADSK